MRASLLALIASETAPQHGGTEDHIGKPQDDGPDDLMGGKPQIIREVLPLLIYRAGAGAGHTGEAVGE